MGLSDEEREKWEEVKEWLDCHFEDIGFWRKQEQLAHDRGERIKELERLVVDTLDFATEGWSYASEYFKDKWVKDKWDYEGEKERLRGRLHRLTTPTGREEG
jgi:hypothetical protein